MTTLALRTPGDRVSLRVPRRATVVCAVLVVATSAVAVVGIATGDFPLPLTDVLATIVGQGDPASSFIIETLRAPRVLTGLLVGAAFGIAGAIFQSVSRNPLGSPDIVGFTTGSTTGALIVILVLNESTGPVGLGAVAGGLVAAVAVYLLSMRNGVQGYRLVLVGIGVAAVLESMNAYLITRATREDAFAAAHWYVGSLNGRGWEHVWPVAVALVLIVPIALAYARPLALLEMGDDAARALGVKLAFVSLAAPQVARRLTRSAAPGLLAAGLMGALMLSASDVIAQRLLDADLPVGVVTGALGGIYLGWLLFTGRGRA